MDTITSSADSIMHGLVAGFTRFMEFIPTLLGALAILAIGWFVSSMVARLIERLLVMAKLENVSARSGVASYLPHDYTLSHLVGAVIKWAIRLVFIQAAANLLGMPQVTAIMNSVLLFIPQVLVAMAILVGGTMLARFFGEMVESSVQKSGVGRPPLFGTITRYAVLGFAVIAAVNQLGIASNLINILMSGLVGSLALSLGLAFGLGGKDVAGQITRDLYENNRGQKRLQAVPPNGPEKKSTGTERF